MCESEVEFSVGKDPSKKSPIFLGFWNQEETPQLINDLEYSVSLIEKKCKKLLQQLIYYRKYSENLNTSQCQNFFTVRRLKEKMNSDNSKILSSSMSDISFQKNFYNSEKITDNFRINFESKLVDINKDLKSITNKMGLDDTYFLFPTRSYQKELYFKAVKEMKKSLSNVKEEFVRALNLSLATKSDSKINTTLNINDLEISKITKNELKLYQNLSKLSLLKYNTIVRKTNNQKSISFPIKRKKGFTSKKHRNIWKHSLKHGLPFITKEHLKNVRSHYQKSLLKEQIINKISKSKSKKLKLKSGKNKKNGHKMYSSSKQTNNSFSVLLNKNDLSNETIYKSFSGTEYKKHEFKEEYNKFSSSSELTNDLILHIDKKIPFVAGTSTSKSFNIGMNLQQCLSLTKYANHLRTKKTSLTRVSDNKLFKNNYDVNIEYKKLDPNFQISKFDNEKNTTSDNKYNNFCNVDSENSCNLRESNKSPHNQQLIDCKENFWISNHCSSFRKSRSKYTKNIPDSFVQYHKLTSHYTHGQKAMIKTQSKTTYTVGSKIMVSDCERTGFFDINKQNFYSKNASGDGFCKDGCTILKMEWSKIYSTFLDLYRKYSILKEQIKNNNQDFCDSDLKFLEVEIDQALEEYKYFLRVYSTFLNLKHQVKQEKVSEKCNSLVPITSFIFENKQFKNQNFIKSTSAMIMRKALRRVQSLQEKIRQIKS